MDTKETWFRWFWRRPGESGWNGCGRQRFASAAVLGKPAQYWAQRLIDEWNRRDAGKYEYVLMEILPGDFDHPNQIARAERKRNKRINAGVMAK